MTPDHLWRKTTNVGDWHFSAVVIAISDVRSWHKAEVM